MDSLLIGLFSGSLIMILIFLLIIVDYLSLISSRLENNFHMAYGKLIKIEYYIKSYMEIINKNENNI